MRNDAIGLWWDDTPPPAPPPSAPEKRQPPERTWERPDYLPGLEEALQFDTPVFTMEELAQAWRAGEWLVFDIECYVNFFQIAFKSVTSGKVLDFIQTESHPLDRETVRWILHSFTVVGFYSDSYDMPMAALALAGLTCAQLKEASDEIINGGHGGDLLRKRKVKSLNEVDHIDLKELAPLGGSLKIYGGRLHAPRMQDLPFVHYVRLSGQQMAIVRWYCVNDLVVTRMLCTALMEQIKLREVLSDEVGIDLRSHSDAQIAEAVIAAELRVINGARAQRPDIAPGTAYRYRVPPFLQYRSEIMRWVLERVRNALFVVSEEGNIGLPPELAGLELPIGQAVYRMGVGGLHSSESTAAHVATDEYVIVDRDVESYYPRIILNQRLYPMHLGDNFLKVYERIVQRRLDAKHRGDKVVSDALKITINGTFGKLGSKWSVLYAPDLLIQVTLTGQLALLMMIERLELAGLQVLSANTDGIVIRAHKLQVDTMNEVIAQWERDTCFKTEEARYSALYSRDVNNYLALKPGGGAKSKGIFTNPWASAKDRSEWLKKNPTNLICLDAVTALLVHGTPIEQTVTQCTDITKFVSVRTVKGGAVKSGVYLGKSIRWYYAKGETGEIVYAMNGNKVPRSDGAWPAMDLPKVFPPNVDHDWYIAEANSILQGIGYK